MPGPGIASATISVDLNGDRIPAEAAVLGREAGAVMGKEHSQAYERAVSEGLTRVGQNLTDEFRVKGRDSALSFQKAFEQNITGEMSRVAREVAGVFSDENGLNKFRDGLSSARGELVSVGEAAQELEGRLQFLQDNRQFGKGLAGFNVFQQLKKDVHDWQDAAGEAEAETRRIDAAMTQLGQDLQSQVIGHLSDLASEQERVGQATRDLKEELRSGLIDHLGQMADETNRVDRELGSLKDTLRGDLINHLHDLQVEVDKAHESALGINQSFDSTRLKSWAADMGRAVTPANALQREMGDLLIHLRDTQSAFNVGALSAKDLRDEFDRVTPRVHVLGDAMGLTRGAIRDIVSGAKDVGTIFGDVGAEADQLKKKVGGLGGAFSGLKGILSQMSAGLTGGGGLLGIVGIVGLIISTLGPLSVLAAAAAGGITILGAAAFSAVGGLVAFYGIFSQITHLDASGLAVLPKQMRDTAEAFQQLIGVYNKTSFEPGQLFITLKEGLTDAFLGTKGLDSALRSFTNTTLPEIGKALAPIGTALGGLFKQVISGLSSKNGLSDIRDLVGEIVTTLPQLGKTAGLAFGIIDQLLIDAQPFMHKFLDDTNNALGSFLTFLQSPKGHDAVTGWLQNTIQILGTVKDVIGQAVGAISKLAANPENIQNTADALQSIGEAMPAIAQVAQDLSTVTPILADTIKAITSVVAELAQAFDPLASTIEASFIDLLAFIKLSGFTLHDIIAQMVTAVVDGAKVMADVASGNLLQAGLDAEKLASDVHKGANQIATDFAALAGNGAALLTEFSASTQKAALDIVHSLGETGGAAKNAAGQLAQIAEAGGVSLSKLSHDKSWAQIAHDLGLTGSLTDQFVAKFSDAIGGRAVTSVKDLNSEGKKDLTAVAANLGLTGKAATAFENLVAVASKGSKAKLNDLARDTSLQQVEHTLGLTGSAARAFEAAVAASMSKSGTSFDLVKGKADNLHYAVTTLPNGKHIVITETGAADAQAQVEALNSQLRALHDRQITISVNAQVDSKFAQGLLGNEFGGIVAGGQQIAGGRRAFAFGGLINTPTSYGNVLAGEAGLEAIVPLTKPLDQVDKSVRQLAAYARGMGSGFGDQPTKVITIAPQITVPSGDPVTIAGYVVDRLVPSL